MRVRASPPAPNQPARPSPASLLPISPRNLPEKELVAKRTAFIVVRSRQRLFLLWSPVPHVEGVRDHPRARLQVLEQLRAKFQVNARQQKQGHDRGLAKISLE